MKRNYITLSDIARRLHVSRVTVSKALNNQSDISEEMTRRVHKAAAEMGYSPNIIARSLSSRRTNMIGVVIPKIAHYFFSSVIEGIYDAAFENHYETILMVSQENEQRELSHLQTLMAMRVDGIIISISQETQDVKRFLAIRKKNIPLVFLDRMPEQPVRGFSSVLNDDREGAFQAVEHAIQLGYRKIGFIGGMPYINIGKNRLDGFTDALNKYGIIPEPEWIIHGGFGKDDGYRGLMRLFSQRPHVPEFIFSATYPVALGIYEAARELGVGIPNDLDIICFGDSDVGSFLSPAISAVRQPARELGIRSVQILLETLRDTEKTREHHVILSTQLIIRETCSTLRRHDGNPEGKSLIMESQTLQ